MTNMSSPKFHLKLCILPHIQILEKWQPTLWFHVISFFWTHIYMALPTINRIHFVFDKHFCLLWAKYFTEM